MRSQALLVRSSYAACSSGVRFVAFLFFFAILFLQQSANRRDVVTNVYEQSHDSGDVPMVDRRLDATMVASMRRNAQVSVSEEGR